MVAGSRWLTPNNWFDRKRPIHNARTRPAAIPAKTGMTMKNTLRTRPKTKKSDDLRPEYRFDYTEAKPNRFAGRIPKGSIAVLLDTDVARLFKSAETVNAVLRALMTTMPPRRKSAAQ